MSKHLSPPKYRHQKSRNLAVVRIHGKDYYLGEYGSHESRQLYAQLIAEKWADSPDWDTARIHSDRKIWPTVDELIALYMTKYVPIAFLDRDGNPSERQYHVKIALRPLHELYGNTPVNEFGSKRLKLVREKMIETGLAEKAGRLFPALRQQSRLDYQELFPLGRRGRIGSRRSSSGTFGGPAASQRP